MNPRPRVFVTRLLPGEALHRLRREADVEVWPEDRPVPRQVLARGLAGVDALLCLLTDRIDAGLMEAAPRLRVISNYAVGFDNVDVAAATRRGIVVTNTPDVLTETSADFTWALLLAAARRVVEGDRMVRAGAFRGWSPTLLLGVDVWGRTLGVVGMGRIGRAVARRAAGFGMRVLYAGRRRLPPDVEAELGATCVTLPQLLETADFITLHVPYSPATHHLIDAEALERLKPTAVLVNTARGPVVDEAALVSALQRGRLRAAALDVYEREPDLTTGLAALDQVVLAPHAASATEACRSRMADMAVDNVLAVLAGRRPPHPVNPEVLP